MYKILPNLLAFITRHPRVKVSVEWNANSWTHNAFRAWEVVFWRRDEIRIELRVSRDTKGKVTWKSYTWEAFISHGIERPIRNFIAALTSAFARHRQNSLQVKYSEMIQLLANDRQYKQKYYAKTGWTLQTGAIAFDATYFANYSQLANFGYSHTVTGSNPFLQLGLYSASVTGGDAGSFTYAASAMTKVISVVNTDRECSQFYKIAPATGANTIQQSSAITLQAAISTSYSGCSQSALADTPVSGGPTTTTSFTISLTPANSASWLIGAFQCKSGTAVAGGTNTTLRRDDPTATVVSVLDSNGVSSPTALNATSTSGAWVGSVLAVAPVSAAGPANVKTWDGLTQSTGVKTYFGLALASVKTVMGLN